jgi:hypothetical protein
VERMTTLQIFAAVANGRMSPEKGARMILENRRLERKGGHMTKLQTIILAIVAGDDAGLLYKFVPSMQEVAGGLAGLSLLMLGWAKQHPADRLPAPAPANIVSIVQQPEVRDSQKGSATIENLVDFLLPVAIVTLAAVALWAVIAFVSPSRAHADQQFGGCNESRSLCAGPAVAVTVGQFNLTTSKFSGGVAPGLGYGVTYQQDRWYAVGLAGYLAFTVGGGEPNQAIPSLMLSFADYVRIGAGLSLTETSGPVDKQWRLLFGLGANFGGTPKYVAERAAR